MINPYRVSLTCSSGHRHFYNLEEPGEIECKTRGCSLTINSSRVFRGHHPYIIWTSNQFQDDSGYIKTFTVIPLTSKLTFAGLPTTLPINPTRGNGLQSKSYALVHQICTVDNNCFKDAAEDWITRMGQLGQRNKDALEERLKYYLDIEDNPDDDWFRQNATSALVQEIYGYLPDAEKRALLEGWIDDLG